MGSLEDKLDAIARVEETVYGGLHEGQIPKKLAKALFALLREGVEKDDSTGTPLSRVSAAEKVDTSPKNNAFKTAVHRIAAELQRCRPADPSLMPASADRLGVACIEAKIGGVPHLVLVSGPTGEYRNAPRDPLLQLKVEFQPLGTEPHPVEAAQEVSELLRATPGHADDSGLRSERLSVTPVAVGSPSPTASNATRRLIVWSVLFTLTVALSLTLSSLFFRWPLPLAELFRPRSAHFNLSIDSVTEYYYDAYGARVSPDGHRLAFLARDPKSGKRFVFTRSIDNPIATPIRESEGEYTPHFWNDDGKSIYFVRAGRLFRASVPAGIPEPIADVSDATRGSASVAGVVLLGSTRGILKVTPDGTTTLVTRLRTTDRESAHLSPYFLPDGDAFFFLAISHAPSGALVRTLCWSRVDGEGGVRVIGAMPSRVEFNSGHLLFARDGTLMARPFDLKRLQFEGDEKVVTPHVWYSTQTGDADFSVARDGLLVAKDAPGGSRLQIIRGGRPTEIPWAANVIGMSIARTRDVVILAIAVSPGRNDLWRWDLRDDTQKRLAFGGAITSPVVTSAGELAFFAIDRKDFADIYSISAAGGGQESPVYAAEGLQAPRGISSDDRFLLFQEFRQQDGDLYCLDLRERNRLIPIAATPLVMEGETGRFSPDNKWILYVSYQSGEPRVYATRFPSDGKDPVPISPGLGGRARWSRDGTKIYYAQGRNVLEYDFRARKLVGEVYHADADINRLEITSTGDLLVVVGAIEPPNRVQSDWRDALASNGE